METPLRSRRVAAIATFTWVARTAGVFMLVMASPLLAASRPAGSSTANTIEIYVDQSDARADDSNPGTSSQPVETISSALELAAYYNEQSVPVRVITRPGIYRESLTVTGEDGATPAALTLQGSGDGVIVSGSDVWTGWVDAGEGIFSHPWPFDWGLASADDWPEHIVEYLDANPIIRRREMVFVEGTPLLQVMSLGDMATTENSFFVSEDEDQLSIHVPSDMDIASALVEVAVRPRLLLVGSRQNVSIQNIDFQHASNAVDEGSAVVIANSTEAHVSNSRFIWNNGTGLGLFQDAEVSIRDAEADHNGIGGFTGFQINDLRVLESEASFNGWRASRGAEMSDSDGPIDPNFIDFAAGQKFFGLRHAWFRNYHAIMNDTGGLWLDSDNVDVRVEDAVLSGNLTQGVMVEASQGPVWVLRSRICGNETGILLNSSSDVRVFDSVLAGNRLGQLSVLGGPRVVLEHDTGNQISVEAENVVVRGNQIAVNGDELAVSTYLEGDLWSRFIGTLKAGNNRYSSPKSGEIFQLPGDRDVTLEEWKTETGVDAGSTFSLSNSDCPLSFEESTSFSWNRWIIIALVGLAFGTLLLIRVARRRHSPSADRADQYE
jgi:hypothetical protein